MWRVFSCMCVLLVCLILCFFIFAGCSSVSPDLRSAEAAAQAGDNKKAYNHYQNVLNKDHKHSEAKKQIAILSKKICADYVALADDAAKGERLTYEQLDKILSILKEGSFYDYDRIQLMPVRDKYQAKMDLLTKELKSYETALTKALQSRDANEARASFNFIKTRYPSSPALVQLEPQYIDLYGSYIVSELNKLVAAGDANAVKEEVARINSLAVTDAGKKRLDDLVARQIVSGVEQVVERIISRRHYYEAFLAIKESGLEQELSALLSRVKFEGGDFYFTQAKKRISRKEMHHAYLQAVKAQELNPDISGLFEVHKQAYDAVVLGIQQNIAISAFESPQGRPGVGQQFSEALISYLFKIAPYGINIVERQKIDVLLQEQRRGMKEVGDLLKVDLIVTGNVMLMDVDRQEQKTKGFTKVKIGEQKKLNPDYEALFEEHGEDIKDIKDAPPKWIMEPQYTKAEYEKSLVTVKGFASVSARIFDASKGSLVYAEQFDAKYEASDEYQQSIAGSDIAPDPLELPTDMEVMEKLRANLVPQLVQVIQKEFQQRKGDFVEQAKYYIARKEPQKAMEPLAQGLLYCVKENISSSDPQVVELRNLIIELTENDSI